MNKNIFLLVSVCLFGALAIGILPARAEALDWKTAAYSRQVKNWLNQIFVKLQKKQTTLPQKKNAVTVVEVEKVEKPLGVNPWHNGIITTVFWVGEKAGPDNGYISNDDSAWDEMWLEHSPKENPFYAALPYTDFNANGRKQSVKNIPWYDAVLAKQDDYSFVKNSWIEIKNKLGKIAYAQVEDVGPYESDDFAYVFGVSAPKNADGSKAGLDVSPAVKTHLGLTGLDQTSWRFVDKSQVPNGPWKQIVTVSNCFWE